MSYLVCGVCCKTILGEPITSDTWAGEFCSRECLTTLDCVANSYLPESSTEYDDALAEFEEEDEDG